MTGGRHEQASRELVYRVLDFLRPRRIAHGNAIGADTYAKEWALSRGLKHWPYVVTQQEWWENRKGAGRNRNIRMLETEKEFELSAYLISFPGAGGTAHCTQAAIDRGWHVVKVDSDARLRLLCPIYHSHREDERWVRAHFGDNEAVVQALLTEGTVL